MGAKISFFIIFLLLGAVAIFAVRNYQLKRQIPAYWPTTSSNRPSPSPYIRTGLPSDWQTFESFQRVYTFKYPSDVNVEEYQDNVRASRKANQDDSAGIFIDFRLGKLPEGVDLRSYVEQQIQLAAGGGEITYPLTEMLVNSYSAYMYAFKGLGAEKHYFIARFDGQTFMHIIDSTADSPAQDFKGAADNIIQTFAFTQ